MASLLVLLLVGLAALAEPCLIRRIDYRGPFRLLPPGAKARVEQAVPIRPGSPWLETGRGALAVAIRDALAGMGEEPALSAVSLGATPCDNGQTDLTIYLFTTRLLAGSPRWRIDPRLRFDRGDGMVGGGALQLQPSPFLGLRIEGAGGAGFLDRAIAAAGSSMGFAYAAGLRHRDEPLGDERLRSGYGYGWVSGRAAGLRYGLQFEQGYQLAERYRAAKALLGYSAAGFTGALGVQYGDATAGAYRKTVFDASYARNLRLADHRLVSLDWRVNGGWLPAAAAPSGERFFGGMRDRRFSEIPGIELRAAPRLRSFGSNRFQLAAAGHERFLASNLTVGLTAWRMPLLPREVSSAPDFAGQIEAGKGTIAATLESYHEGKDPVMKNIEPLAQELSPLLKPLLDHPDELCAESADRLDGALAKAIENRIFGSLPRTVPDCGSQPPIEAILAQIHHQLTRVDRKSIEQRAHQDARLALRAIDILTRELNLFAIEPIFVYDHAAAHNRRGSLSRASVGGGLRFSIASTLGFEIGYAFTANSNPGESAGALFLALRITDLFR